MPNWADFCVCSTQSAHLNEECRLKFVFPEFYMAGSQLGFGVSDTESKVGQVLGGLLAWITCSLL